MVAARFEAFLTSGFVRRLSRNACKNHKSFHGGDFKLLASCFLLWRFINDDQKEVWLLLSKVFRVAYCVPYAKDNESDVQSLCQSLVDAVYKQMLQKPKFHLLLHLARNMTDFGRTASYNTERCEAFNKVMRSYNIHSNKKASSCDIAVRFAKIEQLRLLVSEETSTRSPAPRQSARN